MKYKEIILNNDIYELLVILAVIFVELLITYLFNNKCQQSHLKINVVKTSLLLSFIIFVIVIIYDVFSVLVLKLNIDEISFDIYLIFLCIFLGIPGMYLIIIGDVDLTKQNIYEIPYKSFKEFNDFLNNRLTSAEYKQVHSEKDLQIYTKQKRNTIKVCVSVEIENVTLEKINASYSRIQEALKEEFNYIEKHMWSKMMITFIVNTNKITSDFNRFIKSVDIDKRIIKLPVGISYGGNKLYISNAIDGFDMPYQNKMYKDFMKLIRIDGKRR